MTKRNTSSVSFAGVLIAIACFAAATFLFQSQTLGGSGMIFLAEDKGASAP